VNTPSPVAAATLTTATAAPTELGTGDGKGAPFTAGADGANGQAESADVMTPNVDLVVLTRHGGPLRPEVKRGVRGQRGVNVVLHRVVGQPQPKDCCRWETIARARNEGKRRGNAPWLMFLDDDVELAPGCIWTLMNELSRRPSFAALAADYLGERRAGQIARHVAMGATLFRREALDQIHFTWADNKCECQGCCNDLRRLHWGIDYCPSARAHHLAKPGSSDDGQACVATVDRVESTTATGCVLAAFNRRHFPLFCNQFLRSLRASGNQEPVLALAMGLYPSERRKLERLPKVAAFFRRDNGQFVGRQRLRAFQEVLGALPPETAIAYWDAGDVIFQGRLKPLWELVQNCPDKVLVAREAASHPKNTAVAGWTHGIRDPEARRWARELLYDRPFLNAGFMAGTARTLLKYFRTVAPWYGSTRLAGTSNPGDQMALNLYCHSHPEAWTEVPQGWNYCLIFRDMKTVYRDRKGRYVDVGGLPIYAVHGNGHTLHSVPLRGTAV